MCSIGAPQTILNFREQQARSKTRLRSHQSTARRRRGAPGRAQRAVSVASAAGDDALRGPGQPSTTSSADTFPLRVVIAAGGTGGHVFPAIAIADALRSVSSEAVISFIGGDRLEATAVPSAGYELWRVPPVELARPFHHPSNLLLPLRLAWACFKGIIALIRLRPHVVIGTGGYTAFPACVAAIILRVPLILQEQNALPGLANRFLAPFAALVCTAFQEAERTLGSRRILIAGNPVRRSLFSTARADARERLFRRHFGKPCKGTVEEGDRVVSILGGSLGAANLNEVIERALALFPDYELPGSARPVSFATPEAAAAIASGPPAETEGEDEGTEAGAAASSTSSTPPPAAAATAEEAGAEAGRGPRRLWVVWQTGERDHARVAQRCSHPRLAVTPFVTHMDELYLSSDLVVSRAGAITCSELMATGSASLLLPSPTVADDHQSLNAEALEGRGAAAALPHGLHTAEVLAAEIARLLQDEDSLVEMRRMARAESKMNSADVIAAEAIRIASRRLRTGATASRQLVPLGAMGNAMVRAAVAEAAASVAAASASAAATAPAPPRSSHSPLLQQQPREASRPALAPSAGHAPLRKQQDGVAAAHWLSRQLPSSRGDVEDAGRRLRQTIEHFSLRMATPVTGSGGAGRRAPSGAEAPEVALGLAGAPSPAGGEESPNQQKQSQAGLIV